MMGSIETRLFIVGSALTIVVVALGPSVISSDIQLLALALGVMFLGLPHGALDPDIAHQAGLINTPTQSITFNLVYAATAALVVVVWWWVPVAMLAAFLAFSAWHFSGDWRLDLPQWAQWIAGVSLLLLPVVFHTDAVAEIFTALSGPGGAALADNLAQLSYSVPTGLLGVALMAVWQKRYQTACELASLLILGVMAPPLVFFIIYFCLLHSPRHLRGHFAQRPHSEHPRLWRMLVIYSVATIILLAPMAWIGAGLDLDTLIIRLVFIGLAAITVPHMMLMLYAESKTPTTQC